jgi:hypothetical protein
MTLAVVSGNAAAAAGAQPHARSVWRQVTIGAIVGSAALWLTFRGVEWAELQAALKGVDAWLTCGALILNIAALLVMVVRWQVFLAAIGQPVSFGDAFRAMIVGQMTNILIPLRLGELVRVHALSQQTGAPRTEILVTIAVEKVLDALLFGGSLLVVTVLAIAPERVSARPLTFVLATALLAGLVWVLRFRPGAVASASAALCRKLPDRMGSFVIERFRRLLAGVAALRTLHTTANVAALSVLMIALSVLTNYVLFLAFDLDLSMMAAFILLLLLKAGSVPPSLPGKLGTVNLVTAFALSLYGVSEPVAVGYAVVLYVVTLLPKVLIGAVYAADRSLWLRSSLAGS